MAGINHGQLDGFYVPVRGWAETQEVSLDGEPPTQIGSYKIILQREGWRRLPREDKRRIRWRLVLKGPMMGVVDTSIFPPTANHLLGTRSRDGALYTAGDYLIPQAGDPSCSQGTAMYAVETINVVQGSGAYEGLESGMLQLEGVLNNCPDQPDFLKNNFEVIPQAGGISFQPLP